MGVEWMQMAESAGEWVSKRLDGLMGGWVAR